MPVAPTIISLIALFMLAATSTPAPAQITPTARPTPSAIAHQTEAKDAPQHADAEAPAPDDESATPPLPPPASEPTVTRSASPAAADAAPYAILDDPPLPRARPVLPAPASAATRIYVRIFKRENELELWSSQGGAYRLQRTYPICAWSGNLGPKLREGDYQSPEGFYLVTRYQLKPDSDYHRAFNIGFPNAYDRTHNRTGSFLMVHGACASVGCFAMTDPAIEEIYDTVEKALAEGQPGIPVHIFPFRMTEAALREQADTPWIDFWRNLKEGYDLFEETRIPPKVSVCGKRYEFGEPKFWCKPITGWTRTAQTRPSRRLALPIDRGEAAER